MMPVADLVDATQVIIKCEKTFTKCKKNENVFYHFFRFSRIDKISSRMHQEHQQTPCFFTCQHSIHFNQKYSEWFVLLLNSDR